MKCQLYSAVLTFLACSLAFGAPGNTRTLIGGRIQNGNAVITLPTTTQTIQDIHTGATPTFAGINLPEDAIGTSVVNGLDEALAAKTSTTLTSGHLLVGNGSNVATSVAISGDGTIDNAGALGISTVGGATASDIATATSEANAATATNTVSTIVKRDANGDFGASTITANLIGNADTATTATTAAALATDPAACPDGQYAKDVAADGTLTCAAVDSLPTQTGNGGKYLKTDGSAASWQAVNGGTGFNSIKNQKAETDTSDMDTTAIGSGTLGRGTGSDPNFATWFTFDATAAGEQVCFDSNAITGSYNGEWSAWIKGDASLYELQLQTISTGSPVMTGIALSNFSDFSKQGTNYPATAGLHLCVVATGDGAEIQFTKGHWGEATNLTNVSQASSYGSAKMAVTASCKWTTTSATAANFSADTDCAAMTVTEKATAPGTKIPAAVFSTLEPGNYKVTFTGILEADSTSDSCAFNLSDGTTTSGYARQGANAQNTNTIVGYFRYTDTKSNITLQIQGARISGSTSTCNIRGDLGPIEFTVEKFPLSSQLAATVDTVGGSWSGYHNNTCSFPRTSTSIGDPSADSACTFTEQSNTNFGTVTSYLSGSDKLPGFVFYPKKVGKKYKVCTAFKFIASAAAYVNFELSGTTPTTIATSGEYADTNNDKKTNLCGYYTATSTAATTIRLRSFSSTGTLTIGSNNTTANSVEWTIEDISETRPSPIFFYQVSTSASGGVTHVAATIANNGSSASITSQSGSWISSVSRTGTGAVTIDITAGIFSATPWCSFGDGPNDRKTYWLTKSASQITTQTNVTGGSANDQGFDILCTGPR